MNIHIHVYLILTDVHVLVTAVQIYSILVVQLFLSSIFVQQISFFAIFNLNIKIQKKAKCCIEKEAYCPYFTENQR